MTDYSNFLATINQSALLSFDFNVVDNSETAKSNSTRLCLRGHNGKPLELPYVLLSTDLSHLIAHPILNQYTTNVFPVFPGCPECSLILSKRSFFLHTGGFTYQCLECQQTSKIIC